MSYRYDNQQKKRRIRVFGIGVLLLLLLFTPVYSWLFNILEQPFANAWQNKGRILSTGDNFFSAFYGKTQILEENKSLQQKIQRLEIDNLRTDYLATQLQAATDYVAADLYPTFIVSGGVVGSLDSLIISYSEGAFRVGDGVYIDQHVLVGFVSDIYDTNARVTLYSDSQQKKEGVLFPHSANLIAQGLGSRSMLIEVPREIPVEAGDIFYDLENPGSIIGIVQGVEFDSRDPFQRAYLSYPININKHQLVGVKNNLQ